MSANHLQHIEALITQAQEFLYAVQRNQAPDMDSFDHIQKTQFQALKALGPVPPDTPYLSQIRVRMEYLESLNREMIEVIKKLLTDSRNQLKAKTTQRRGISGYQRSLFGRNRGKGVWRGRG